MMMLNWEKSTVKHQQKADWKSDLPFPDLVQVFGEVHVICLLNVELIKICRLIQVFLKPRDVSFSMVFSSSILTEPHTNQVY